MFRCAGAIGLALALGGCVDNVVLNDVHVDGSADAIVPKDAQSTPDVPCGQRFGALTFVSQYAQLLILLDRSSNMQSSFTGTDTSREAAVQDALVSRVEAFEDKIKLGFGQFPVDPAVSKCAPGSCCADEVGIMQPTLNNGQAVADNIRCNDPNDTSCSVASDDSPSNAALAMARDSYSAWYPPSHPTNDAQYVLLITHSEPRCAGEDQCPSARSAANDLADARVGIFVLSVDYNPDQWSSCLRQIARKHGSQPLYPAGSVSDLGDYLDQIFTDVAESFCTLSLNSGVLPPPLAQLQVSLGKRQVSPADWNGQDGWSANPDKTIITLSGSACSDYLFSPEKLIVNYTLPDACNSWWP